MVKAAVCGEDNNGITEPVTKNYKNRKTPGMDNLNAEFFKYSGAPLKDKLLQLFNKIWHNHQLPKDWETKL